MRAKLKPVPHIWIQLCLQILKHPYAEGNDTLSKNLLDSVVRFTSLNAQTLLLWPQEVTTAGSFERSLMNDRWTLSTCLEEAKVPYLNIGRMELHMKAGIHVSSSNVEHTGKQVHKWRVCEIRTLVHHNIQVLDGSMLQSNTQEHICIFVLHNTVVPICSTFEYKELVPVHNV